MPKVALVKAQRDNAKTKHHIRKALELIDFDFSREVRTVAIKVNLCYYWKSSTGYTTDPNMVSALIETLTDQYGADLNIRIVESDASAMRTRLAFPILGYKELAMEENVELFNLSKDAVEEKEVVVNERKIRFKIPRTVLDSDLFINFPKLKVMRDTHLTCALKNLFGCIAYPRKVIYHSFLNEAIVGINKVLKPHLTIVDGLVALGRFPVKLDLIMASLDPFSVDWISAQIMGYNPSAIGFLKLAVQEGIGEPEKVKVYGRRLEEFRKRFPKENILSRKVKWWLQLEILKAYRHIANDVIPPALEDA